MFLALLFIFLSGCTKTYFYKVAEEKVHYDSGYVYFYLLDLKNTIALSKNIQYKEDSVYNDFDSRLLRFRNVSFDTSKYLYLGIGNANYSNERRLVPKTFLIADSIKILPKPPFEFPEYDGVQQMTGSGPGNSRSMEIEPILVPKDYKDDFKIEYILSVYGESDSTLLMRKPVKLKIEYKSRTYSPFIQGT